MLLDEWTQVALRSPGKGAMTVDRISKRHLVRTYPGPNGWMASSKSNCDLLWVSRQATVDLETCPFQGQLSIQVVQSDCSLGLVKEHTTV